MVEKLIEIFKNEELIKTFSQYFFVIFIVLLVLNFFIKNQLFYKIIRVVLFIALTIFIVLKLGNALTTDNYNGLLNFGFILLFFYLLNFVPKFLKWYDKKVDKLS